MCIFLDCPHNDKDASTFVSAVSSFFILHNSLIHLFDFGYHTIKLDKCHTNKGVLANHRHRMETDPRRDGQRGQRDRETDTTEADSLRRTQALCLVDENGLRASS